MITCFTSCPSVQSSHKLGILDHEVSYKQTVNLITRQIQPWSGEVLGLMYYIMTSPGEDPSSLFLLRKTYSKSCATFRDRIPNYKTVAQSLAPTALIQ